MKKVHIGRAALVSAAICVATVPSPSLADAVTDTNEVTAVVAGWQSAREALGDQLTASPASVKSYSGLGGTGTYYVVTLEGGGFVVTSGDTSLEPVLAYSKTGEWVDDVKRNPLMAMVQIDVAAAMRRVEDNAPYQSRRLAASSGGAQSSATAAKWAKYKDAGGQSSTTAAGKRLAATAPSSDLRISPLVQSSWNQSGHGENYYTPNNFVCGCTATMCAQLMRYWKWPTASVTANADYRGGVTYGSDSSSTSTVWTLSGGYYKASQDWRGRWTVASTPTAWEPAFGGTYDWANMPLNPTSVKTAIGKLTRDCGIVSLMSYANGGSGAAITLFAHRAVDQFGYANGKCMNGWRDVTRDAMLASIDAGIPCGMSVFGSPGGHAIVADGYGYDSSGTLFVHFNMGWGNVGSDTWYTPPAVGSFDSVGDILYNIYPPTFKGTDLTIVSGRVLNGSGSAVGGVTVTAVNRETGESFTATSSNGGTKSFNGETSSTVGKGIYYFMLPAGFYSFTATSGGNSAKVEAQVKPCISAVEGQGTPGNIHGLDLTLGTAIAAPAVALAHRWSFSGTTETEQLADSVGSSSAAKIGSKIAISGGKAVCTGTGAGQGSFNLGSGLLNTDAATIEIWAAPNAIYGGSRIVEYGTGTGSYFMLAWTKQTDIYNDCAELVNNGTSSVNDGTLAPYTLGKQYHISVTFERQPDGSTLVRAMKRDAASGALLRDAVYTMATGIHTISSPLLRLGRSFWNNTDGNATYDEVRVWNGALTDAQLKASVLAGPDANLSTLPWNASAVKYVAKAVWQGGTTAPTASSLASSANWSCTDQNGDAITGVPEARSVVIIPNGQTAFTIPEGYTPAWRKVRFGTEGAATTQLASKNFTASTAYANLNPSASDYTLQGDADISSGFDRRVGAPDTANVPEGLAGKQFRYDGWVNVSAEQAGRWKIAAYADDYAALRIDDEWLAFSPLGDNTSGNTRAVGADVSKGWHRFTLVVSDNYGGYCGCAATTDHLTATPVLVSINGGNAIAFTSSNFAFGSPTRAASAVTLTGDCDLSAVDEVLVDAGSDIDLAGHTLTVPKTTSSFVGAAITDSGSSGVVSIADGGSIDTANLTVAEGITVFASEDAGVYIWNGASGADWTVPGNWLLNGSSPVAAPGAGSTVKFTNDSAISVGGTETLKVAKIVTTGAKVTFNCPVAFDGTYLVDNASNAPTFPGGATATKPDDSLTSMNAASHVLPDGLMFTEDWTVPTQASGNPFVVPAGASISGQKITGTEYKNNQPCIRIDAGAVATFTEVPSARTFVFSLNGGRLVVTGDVLVHNGGNSRDLCYYQGYNGTVEANGVYKSASGDGAITCYVTNFVIGAGGFGMLRRDYMWNFAKPCTLMAKADFTIHEPHTAAGALDGQKDNDWGLNFQGHTFTVDTAGYTVTFDSYVRESAAKLVKEGEGELVLRSRAKLHTGGTEVKGGKVTVERADNAGKGTTTVYSSAMLAFASAVTSQGYPIVVKNGGTLEWAAAVNDTSTLTLEAGAIVKPKAAAAFTASTVTLPSSGTVTVDLMDAPFTANTAVSILGGVSDASKFTALVPSGVTGSLSIDGTTLVYTPTAVSDVSDADYVWAGANGADWAVASNWRVNGQAPATAPTAKDTIRFDSNAIVGGTGTLNVYKIVATGSAAVVFDCPVQFRTTYKVVKGTGAVKFPGGATATYPDASIRTSSSTDLARTLDGVFTFTEDWSVPAVGDKPWIVPNGSTVVGKDLTGADSKDNRILRIEQGATATFTIITIGADKGNVDVNGFLEATEAIYVNTGSYNQGYFGKSGNTGTVKAPLMTKTTTSEGVYCYIPNLIVGAGGVGTSARDHFWRFMQDTTITATDDFHFLGWYKTSADWGLDLNGKKVTVNVPEGLTVTMGINVYGGGSIRKTGAGKLVMTNTDKNGQTGYVKTYTGGTVIDEGVVYVAAVKDNQIGTGAVTVGANGRLELAPGVTLKNIVKTSTDGAGSIYMGDGSSIAVSADTPCRLASFEVAPGGTATITTSSSANAGAVLLSGVSADSASRLNIPSGFTLAGGMVYVQVADVALTHRWSFNGTDDSNLTDSVGGAVAKKMKKTRNSGNNATTGEDNTLTMTWRDGKLVLADGNGKGFLNFGELLDPAVGGTIEMWATRVNVSTANKYLASYYIPDEKTGDKAPPDDFFTMNVNYANTGEKLRYGMISQCANNCARTGEFENKSIMGMVGNMPYHVSLTFAPDGNGGTVVRWMIRDVTTGFLLSEQRVTAANWTLATASSAWSFAVGVNPFCNSADVVASEFDEVRSWNGVLSDEQLKASAIAGPDAPLGGGVAGVAIPADTTFDVPMLGGYGYRTDSIVTLGTGAKIRFDTTDYFGTGLRFKAGGIVVPSGSVLDYVELSDGANYTATMEDANTVLVQLKPGIAYESTWKGGTPSSAADLANPANWTSVNAAGEAITAAPGAKTTVILPAASLATFTVPEGAEPVYGRVLLGGHTATQRGRYATKPNAVLSAFREVGLGSYVSIAAEGIEAINGGANTSWQSTYLANGQVRFDGWVYVSAAQAGKWDIKTDFDNLSTFAIDGEWVFVNPYCLPDTTTAGCFVSEGWHRFTFIAGDTGRSQRGCEVTVNGVKVPFSISVNGGAAVAFHTFTFGSDAGTVTLSGDADWRALGELDLAGGVTIDLNGHNLAVADITRSSLGGSIVNGATGLSVLYVAGAADESKAKASGMVASEVLIKTYVGPAADLYWNLIPGLTDWTTSDAAWTNAAGVAKAFIDNANATIADAATINIPSDVTANNVTVSADGDVTLQGAGKIGGSGMFTKGGTGTLTFNATGGLDQQILLITNGVFKVGNDLKAADALGGSMDDTPIIVKDAGTLSLKNPGDTNAGVTRNKLIRISGDGYNGQGAIVGQDRIWRGIANLVLDDDASIGCNQFIHVSNEGFNQYVRNNASIYGPGKTLTIKSNPKNTGGFIVRHADVTLGQLDVDGSVLTLHGSNGGNTFDIANGVHLRNGAILQFQGTPANIPSVTVDSGASTISVNSGSSGATVVGAVTVANGASLTQSGHAINYNGAVNGLTVAAGTANFNGGADNLKVTGGTANVNSAATGLTVSGGTVNVGAAVTGLAVSGATPGTTLIAVGNGGSIDLTGATVDFKTAPSASFVLATGVSADSFIGALPTPTVNGQRLKGWKVVKSGNDLKLRKASGVMIMVN